MAKLIYAAIASLDGYVEDEEGRFDWAAPDDEVHAFVNDLERPIGTYLYGRRMYETMVFWETVSTEADEPAVDAMRTGPRAASGGSDPDRRAAADRRSDGLDSKRIGNFGDGTAGRRIDIKMRLSCFARAAIMAPNRPGSPGGQSRLLRPIHSG